MTNFENTVLKLDELPRDEKILTGRIAHCKDDDGNARKYTIGEKLGEGGMGVVYQGIDEKGQKVALKFLKYKESKLVKALKKESKLMAAIEHQNILKVLGFYEDVCLEGDGKEPMPMMVTEYIDGLKALDVTNVGKNFCKYTVQIFNGLEAIHGRGLIHRDVKPGNILVTPDGDVKISDFGLSAIIDEHTGLALSMSVSMQATSQKGIAGTRAYLPKNIEELKNPDKRTDLYSLGLVLYQMIVGDASKFPDVRAEARAEKAAKVKKLPMPEELAEAVCDLTLEERSERPADITAIKAKRRELYTAIEDVAGLPVYWTKLCEIIKHMAPPHAVAEIDKQLKSLDKDQRIEGAAPIIRRTALKNSVFEQQSNVNLFDEITDFFSLKLPKRELPKNKEDAEFVIQAIKYCLENDKQIRIDHRMDYLMDWENRIKEYQSKFGINAAETLGILDKVVENEQETVFNDLFKAIESRGELLCVRTADIRARILTYASRNQLTQDQAEKLNLMLDKPKNTEAKNEPEDIAVKYIRLAKSLEGKTVSQEFKEAFAFAAYKEGISKDYIDDVLLNTIDNVRKKSLAERIKKRIRTSKLVRELDLLVNEAKSEMPSQADARIEAEYSAVGDMRIDKRLKYLSKLGRKYNIFVGDLIEKVILKHAFRFPALHHSNPRISFQKSFKNTAQLGHKYRVNIGEDTIKEFREITKDEDYITEIKQQYPNAFKEAPKFEDLKKLIEETPKLKDLEKIVETEPKEEFSLEDSFINVAIALMPYMIGGMVGTFAGFMSDLALYGLSGGGEVTLLGCGAGLGTVFGLRTYNAWKKARKAKSQNEIEWALEYEKSLLNNGEKKDFLKIANHLTRDNINILFPAMLKSYYPSYFDNLARAAKCHGGTEIIGADKQQLGPEIKKYTIRSDKYWSSIDLLKLLLRDMENPENVGVVTKCAARKDLLRRNYLEMEITFYEKKNKIDEKIEKKEDLTDLMAEKPSFLWHNEQGLKYGPSRDEERDLMTEKPKPFSSLEKQVKAKATEEPKPESEPIQKEPEQSIPVQEEPKQTLQSPVQEQEDDEDDDEDERMLEQ